MKKIILFILFLLTLFFCSCSTTNKIKDFNEFLDSESMDLEMWIDSSTKNEKVFDIKFNENYFIIINVEGTIFIDFNRNILFFKNDEKKSYISLGGLGIDINKNDFIKYVLNINSDENELTFDYDINNMLIDYKLKDKNEEALKNFKCEVTFENENVSLIVCDIMSFMNEQSDVIEAYEKYNLNVIVNNYGINVIEIEVPNKDEYNFDLFLGLYLIDFLTNIINQFN